MKERVKKKNNWKEIIKKHLGMYFSQEYMHKGQLISWIIADIIKITGLCFVWIASSNITGSIDQGYLVTYYILILVVGRLMADITPEEGIRQILNGKFSNLLLKPTSHINCYIGNNLGSNLFRLVVSVPAFLGGMFLALKLDLWVMDFNPYLIFLALLAVMMGFLINFFLGNIFSLLAFYNKNMEGMRIFYYNIVSLLSGEFIPIVILPFLAQFVLKVLPFRYTLSFPIEILVGRMTNYDIYMGFVIGIIWLVALYFLYKILYSISIRRYAAEGI